MMFKKCLCTVYKLCKEMKIEKVGDRIGLHYTEITATTLLRLLLRVKELFVMRVRAIRILRNINERE